MLLQPASPARDGIDQSKQVLQRGSIGVDAGLCEEVASPYDPTSEPLRALDVTPDLRAIGPQPTVVSTHIPNVIDIPRPRGQEAWPVEAVFGGKLLANGKASLRMVLEASIRLQLRGRASAVDRHVCWPTHRHPARVTA
jgi:hypothetical protein